MQVAIAICERNNFQLPLDSDVAVFKTFYFSISFSSRWKNIKTILDNPDFSLQEAIHAQIKLLELQYRHIGELITITRKIMKKVIQAMNYEGFNFKKIEHRKDQMGTD